MLKWLRKYNTFILVVGGVLLMVAWLLPETIKELGQSRWGKSPMRLAGSKVSASAYSLAVREHEALSMLLGRDMLERGIRGGVNADHWLMLQREADEAGYMSGRFDGAEFLNTVAKGMVQQMAFGMDQAQIDEQVKLLTANWTTNAIPRILGATQLTEDQLYRALGKLHGVSRMQAVYSSGVRYSDRRLISAAKTENDSAKIDYIVLPPDKEAAAIPEPDEAAIESHYAKFKDVKPGTGDTGIGYLLPDRVKLAWLTVDQLAIESALAPNAVEVRKRFLKQYPTGQMPAGETEQAVMSRLEADVRTEMVADLLRKVDQVVKTEFEKSTRKLETDGDYRKIAAGTAYQPIDFKALATTVGARMTAMTGSPMPAPAAEVRDVFMGKSDVQSLPGIGQAALTRGTKQIPFSDLVYKVKEIAGRNELVLQTGVPSLEYVTNATGSRFYFMVIDGRKESSPENLDDVRARVVKDIKRLAAYEKMKGQLDTFKQLAISQGLEASGKGMGFGNSDMGVRTGARVDSRGITPGDAALNDATDFRKDVVAAAEALDPLGDVSKLDAAPRTVAGVLPKSQSLVIAQITAVSPLTTERYRERAGGMWQSLARRELNWPTDDPFSLSRMEKRLKVEYLQRDKEREEEKAAAEAKS